jgi:hypothetical protein
MGAACTSSYQATQPDWHLLGVAARTSRQIKPKTQLRSAKAWVRLARGDTSNILTVNSSHGRGARGPVHVPSFISTGGTSLSGAARHRSYGASRDRHL